MGGDPYDGLKVNLLSSAMGATKLTKSDSTALEGVRGLKVGVGGTANITMANGDVCDDYPLDAGYHPIRISHLRVGGTADNIWALY
ncbi:MAG: hypothetical protein AAF228_04740 [Pseudomonadota bacterium]